MTDLNDLMYFAGVVEHGGFSAAGRRLGIPKSRLSRRIAALEARMGVRLLQRTSRRVALTSVGEHFYEKCRAVMTLAESANDVVAQVAAEPQGDVRLSCPIPLAQAWLTPLMPVFMKAFPKVRLHVTVTSRRVDPVEERIDVVLRVRKRPFKDSSLVLRKLGESTDLLVASSAYLDARGRPKHPEDLEQWTTMTWPGAGDRHLWVLTDGHRIVEVSHKPRLVTDDMFALREAAVQGIGITLLPSIVCASDLRAARLELVLPTWSSPPSEVQALFTSRQGMLPSVRALLEFLDLHRDWHRPYRPGDPP